MNLGVASIDTKQIVPIRYVQMVSQFTPIDVREPVRAIVEIERMSLEMRSKSDDFRRYRRSWLIRLDYECARRHGKPSTTDKIKDECKIHG